MIGLPQLTANQYGLIGAIAVLLTQVANFLQSRINMKKIHELHLEVNSRLSELLNATRGQARAEGHAAGMKEQRDSVQKDTDPAKG